MGQQQPSRLQNPDSSTIPMRILENPNILEELIHEPLPNLQPFYYDDDEYYAILNMETNAADNDPNLFNFDEYTTPHNAEHPHNTGEQNMTYNIPNQAQSNFNQHSNSSIQTNQSSDIQHDVDNAIRAETVPQDLWQQCLDPLTSSHVIYHSERSDGVAPIFVAPNHIVNPQSNMTTVSDIKQYLKEGIENDDTEPNPIQIKGEPRQKFRPRTQNESKIAAHFLRCDDGSEFEHPAIGVQQEWASQSKINIIEVTLVDILREPHPYILHNKDSVNGFSDNALIFKITDGNTLYFRLTNQDFLDGYKTFTIELLKRRQDAVITKNLIQQRQLDKSMLRFTRYFQDEHGALIGDDSSVVYSRAMEESYGDVSVALISPEYGPMDRSSMVFILLKGRFTRKDISIFVSVPNTEWCEQIQQFSLNGNFIYFAMPVFPILGINRLTANITIRYNNEILHESDYLYLKDLDQLLANTNMNQSMAGPSAVTARNMSNNEINQTIASTATASRGLSRRKPIKRSGHRQTGLI